MVRLWLVNTQMSPAMFKAVSAISRAERSVLFSRARSGLGVGTAGTHGDQAVFGLDHVTVAGDDQEASLLATASMASRRLRERSVRHPGQFDGGTDQVALVFFQLAFKTLEQGEGIGGGTGEAGDDLAVVQATDFLRVAFHHGIAEGNRPSPPMTTLPWRRTETMVVKGESPRSGAKMPVADSYGVGGRISTGDEWSCRAGPSVLPSRVSPPHRR